MLYLTQRTNRHVAKKLNTSSSPAVYVSHYGVFGTKGYDNDDSGYDDSYLNSPWGIVSDPTNNIYVCDYDNQRIVKLNSSMVRIGEYSTRSTVGCPCSILLNVGDLYVVGMYDNAYVRVQRLTTALSSVTPLPFTNSNNLNTAGSLWFRPTGICSGFAANSFIVCGSGLDLFVTIENPITHIFSSFTSQHITGETTTWPKLFTTTTYNSVIKHSNGDMYLNNGRLILRVDSTFTNIGDSNFISRTVTGLREGAGGSLLLYDNEHETIMRYNSNMNFIENVYWNTGITVALDAYDIMDFTEI